MLKSLVILLFSGLITDLSTPPFRPYCDSFSSAEGIRDKLNLKVDESVGFDEIVICVAPNYISYRGISYYELDGICKMESRNLEVTHDTINLSDDWVWKLYGVADNGACHGKLAYTDLTSISDNIDPVNLIDQIEGFKKSLRSGNRSELNKYFDLSLWDRFIDSGYRELIRSTKLSSNISVEAVSSRSNDGRVNDLLVMIDDKP